MVDRTTDIYTLSGQMGSKTEHGYFYYNSSFYNDGNNHDTNADVIQDVANSSETTFKTTHTGRSTLPSDTPLDSLYDTSTGLITLHGAKNEDILLFRFQIDVSPDADESSADICLSVNSPLGFSFAVEEQILSMSDGADRDYIGLATIPIFVGSSMQDNGTPATITPKLRMNFSGGDIKPRGFVAYWWRN